MEEIRTAKIKAPAKPLTLLRGKVRRVIKDFEACGHNFYVTKIIYPAHSNEFNGINEDTADFLLIDATRGGGIIRMKCDGRETEDDIRVYLFNYKRVPVSKKDYTHLIFTAKD